MNNITEILVGVLTAIVGLISVFLIPWIKTKLNNEQMAQADALITYAVGAAEQLYNSKEGQAKKDYVLAYLESQGIKVDMETIEVMIENSVLRLHNELVNKK